MSDTNANHPDPAEHHDTLEDRVRQRAYHLWEAAGRPHGHDAGFWEEARRLEAAERPTSGGATMAKSA